MIIDSLLEFSDRQSLAGTAATPSTDVIDTTSGAARDISLGEALWAVVRFPVALAGTSPTITVEAQTDDSSSFSSPVSQSFGPVPASQIGRSGIAFPLKIAAKRYLRMNYRLGGTSPTATVSAWLTDQEPESWVATADGPNA